MKINFKNKKVLISGGSKGIGFSIATFVNADANVSIISSNQKNLDRAKETINKKIFMFLNIILLSLINLVRVLN